MNNLFLILPLLLVIPVSPVFATIDDVFTDKSIYYEGDVVIVSGTISSENMSPAVSVVVLLPDRSNFASIGLPTFANSDGSFSTSITSGGNLWSVEGIYPIKVTSENHSLETTIEYFLSPDESEPTPEP
ncbi:MAG: hypothetical protein LVO36_00360, partial [Nitrosopumilus sp. (ex Thoosa mismalolli)]|nr:hypothetical protein [Nitrosopumilus sp. (ex Thoosa mismalolli)]